MPLTAEEQNRVAQALSGLPLRSRVADGHPEMLILKAEADTKAFGATWHAHERPMLAEAGIPSAPRRCRARRVRGHDRSHPAVPHVMTPPFGNT